MSGIKSIDTRQIIPAEGNTTYLCHTNWYIQDIKTESKEKIEESFRKKKTKQQNSYQYCNKKATNDTMSIRQITLTIHV